MKLFELIGEVIINTSNAQSNLRSLEGSAQQTANKMEQISQKMNNLSEGIKNIGSKMQGIGAGMSAGVTAPIIGAMTGAVAATQEWRQEMARVDTAFEASVSGVEKGGEVFKELYNVVGDEGVAGEAAQQLAMLANTEEDLKNMTTALTGVYGTFGASLPIEGLAEAVNHTAKLGEVQGPLADAFEWVGINVDEENGKLSKMNSENERAAYLSQRLATIYGDEAEIYKKKAADIMAQRNAQANLNDALSKFAELILPIVTQVTQKIADLINKFNSLDEGQQKLILKAALIIAAVGPVILILGALITSVGAIVGGVGKIITLFSGLGAAAGVLSTILSATIGFIFSPAGLIIVGIMAVIAGIVLLIKNFDKVKSFAYSLVEGLGGAWEALKNGAKSAFDALVDIITAPIRKAFDIAKGIVDNITNLFKIDVDLSGIKIPNWVKNLMPDDWFSGDSDEDSSSSDGGTKTKFFAKGGIMKSATEFARVGSTSYVGGEAGAEAIMPLQGKNMIPFADAVANRINQNQQPQGVNVQNKFEIASLVVREEADIKKIAQQLEKMKQSKNRLRGSRA